MRYTVKAYLCTNFSAPMNSLETDSIYEVQDFVLDNTQKGYNCLLADNDREEANWIYAEKINYADLIMEQQEQM